MLRRTLLLLSVAVGCFHCVAAQSTITNSVRTDGNGTVYQTTKETFANKTEVSTVVACDTNGNCVTEITVNYPILGPCYFRQYRIRWLPLSTDITKVPVLNEVILLTKASDGVTDEVVANGVVSLPGRTYPNIWSHPEDTMDTYNTSWLDPELRPLLVTFVGGANVHKVCLQMGRVNPSALVAVDGTMNPNNPTWYVRVLASPITSSACYTMETDCEILVDQSVPSETFQFQTPKNFQLHETEIGSGVYIPVPCAQYGACVSNGSCYDYGVGPLCNQCSFSGDVGATTNGTRLREGELCDECPESWLPWVKLIVWYVLWWLFVAGVAFIQFRATKAPMFSPAAQAEAKVKEKEAEAYRKQLIKVEADMKRGHAPPDVFNISIDHEVEKEAQQLRVATLSPVLAAGLIRHVMDHHVLCCLAWEYSGLGLCWPISLRQIAFAVNMDWWNILSLQCVIKTFYVDDAIWFGLGSMICNYLLWCGASYLVYNDAFGCTKTPEQKMLSNRLAMEEAFSKLDLDRNGKLEIHEILKAVEPPEALKKVPKAFTCVLSAFILWSFFQNPLYTRIWLTNFDCATLSGKSYLRHDLRVECDSSNSEYTLMAYISLACFGVFNVGAALASMLLIFKARIDTTRSENEEGEITTDYEAAYSFMLAGLGRKKWWFSSWKMLLKEVLPVLLIVDRSGKAPMDPGVGNGPAFLAIIGVFLGLVHEQLHPFDRLYRWPLGTIERLSWIAFCTAPLVKLVIGNRIEVAVDKGTPYVGQWTKEAESIFEYSMIGLAGVTWLLPFAAAAYFIAGEELGFTRVHTINIEVAERVHVTLPPKGRERRQLCKSMAALFEHALLSVARMADEADMPTIAPASAIEGALLVVMREDAAYWGDVHAGEHPVLNVEHESLLWTIGLLQRDREKKDMSLCRTIIDAGGLAETCLRQGIDINGLKVNLGDKKRPEQEVIDEATVEATVIFFCFSLERLELRSAGFKEGERKPEANQCRPGVLRAVERGIAVAVACAEQALDVRLTPVGLDRALVTCAIKCTDAQDMQIREEWLRTSLGTKDSRNRWCKGMETDLARVGVTGSEGKSLMVRFSKGSKPQRSTDDGAIRLMNAAVKAASLGLDRAAVDYKNEEKPIQPIGKTNNNAALDVDQDDLDPFDNEGLRLLNVTNLAASKGKGKQIRERTSELTPGEVEGARRRGAGKGRSKGKALRAPNSVGPVMTSAA